MFRRIMWLAVGLCLLFFVVAGWYFYRSRAAEAPRQATATSVTPGRYVAYKEGIITDQRFDKTILFFARPGSEESDAFDGELAHSTLPDSTQIVRVNIGTSSELAKQYTVTLPPTFVRVDRRGHTLATWVGYGHLKTLDEVLRQTQ